MNIRTTLPCAAAAATLLLAAFAAQANPTVTPGLWENRMSMKSSDPRLEKQMADAQRAMAAMPPEQRKMMEQMMAQRGVSMPGAGAGGGMTMRVCITPEQAARQELPAPNDKCTHRIAGRTPNSLKFAIECPAEQARGEGETTFTSPKAYDGRFRMERQRQGATETMDMQVSARWVAADCGNLQPKK